MIPVEMMRGCEAKLEERMEHFPETRRKYEGFRKFAYPEKEFPWAKAIVIVSFWYGKYRIPAAVRGHIAKYYLTETKPGLAGLQSQRGIGEVSSGQRAARGVQPRFCAYRAALGGNAGGDRDRAQKQFLLYGKGLVSVSGSVPYR